MSRKKTQEKTRHTVEVNNGTNFRWSTNDVVREIFARVYTIVKDCDRNGDNDYGFMTNAKKN